MMLEDNLYLENLKEFIQDEKRIVTYKWLSRKLDVPTDTAKQMLYSYVDHCRASKWCKINVIYVITGDIDTDSGKAQRVCLVAEDELEATKATLNPLKSVHIYSVQQTRLKDSSTLFLADYDICKEHIASYSRWSPIDCPVPDVQISSTKCPTSTTNTPSGNDTQMAGNKTESDGGRTDGRKPLPVLSGRKCGRTEGSEKQGGKERKMKESVNIPMREQSKSNNDKPPDNGGTKSMPRKPEMKKGGGKKQKAAVKGSVASFFTKQLQAATVKKGMLEGSNCGSTTATCSSSPSSSKSTHVATSESKFSSKDRKNRDEVKLSQVKSASASRDPETSKTASSVRKGEEWLKGLGDSDIDDGSDSDCQTVVPVEKEVSGKKGVSNRTSESKKKEHRKRKRIQNISSDEEEIGNVVEIKRQLAEDVRDAKSLTAVKRRKRVKRLKTKMYTTEDGAMVTEKVWENVTTDESDSDDKSCSKEPKDSPGKRKLDKCSPVKGTKQALLMNYFIK